MVQILLVEDDAAIRSALMRALREQGHTVNAVDTGMAALTSAVAQRPDVVLLDLGLPDIDGADVLSMLRSVSDQRRQSELQEALAQSLLTPAQPAPAAAATVAVEGPEGQDAERRVGLGGEPH